MMIFFYPGFEHVQIPVIPGNHHIDPIQVLDPAIPDLNNMPMQQQMHNENMQDIDMLNGVEQEQDQDQEHIQQQALVAAIQDVQHQEEVNLSDNSILHGSPESAASVGNMLIDNQVEDEAQGDINLLDHDVILALPVAAHPPEPVVNIEQIHVGQVLITPQYGIPDSASCNLLGSDHFPEWLLPANYDGPPPNLNLNLKLTREPSQTSEAMIRPSSTSPELYRLWAKHFSPAGCPDMVVHIPSDWDPFFTSMLLSPEHFDWAKGFLTSQTWSMLLSCAKEAHFMAFAIPNKCPPAAKLICISEIEETDSSIPQDSDSECPLQMVALNSTSSPMVDSDVRRSPRIKTLNNGFKHNSCASKNCLACAALPPSLPQATMKAIGEGSCKLKTGKIYEKSLKSKNKRKLPVGEKMITKKSLPKHGKGEAKTKKTKNDD